MFSNTKSLIVSFLYDVNLISTAKVQQSPETALTQFSGDFTKIGYSYRYSLSSEGFAPKFVCTYRLKCESDEMPNISLMSVNERLRSRSSRLMSSDGMQIRLSAQRLAESLGVMKDCLFDKRDFASRNRNHFRAMPHDELHAA